MLTLIFFGIGTKKDMRLDIGKKHNTAILLNWKHGVYGIMQETIMYIVLFNLKLMESWLSLIHIACMLMRGVEVVTV